MLSPPGMAASPREEVMDHRSPGEHPPAPSPPRCPAEPPVPPPGVPPGLGGLLRDRRARDSPLPSSQRPGDRAGKHFQSISMKIQFLSFWSEATCFVVVGWSLSLAFNLFNLFYFFSFVLLFVGFFSPPLFPFVFVCLFAWVLNLKRRETKR